MKSLYIIRHAKSDKNNPSLDDFERPLNGRGQKNALFMGKKLAESNIHPDLIISSPAVRAKTTAEAIAEKVDYAKSTIVYEESLYLADKDDITKIVKKISAAKNTVFLVGHNPGITEFAEYISGCDIGNIPTCGIFCVTLKKDDWKSIGSGSAEYVSFMFPKQYEKN